MMLHRESFGKSRRRDAPARSVEESRKIVRGIYDSVRAVAHSHMNIGLRPIMNRDLNLLATALIVRPDISEGDLRKGLRSLIESAQVAINNRRDPNDQEKTAISWTRASVRSFVVGKGYDYNEPDVVLMSGNPHPIIPGFLSKPYFFSPANTIFIPHTFPSIYFKHAIKHEWLHANSFGFRERAIEEGFTELLNVLTAPFGNDVVRPVSYMYEVKAAKLIYDLVGEGNFLDAYFRGFENGIEMTIGSEKWGKLNNLARRHRNEEQCSPEYFIGFERILNRNTGVF
ncbi:MAG: hypothetical protein WC527_04595 [Candidatus Margulisiibacteriota bacterium]